MRYGWVIRILSDFQLLSSKVEKMARRNEGRKVAMTPNTTGT